MPTAELRELVMRLAVAEAELRQVVDENRSRSNDSREYLYRDVIALDHVRATHRYFAAKLLYRSG